MIIRSIHLRNIRSYLDDTIDFTPGTTLLSGDIGCGKTTILLAIEFAIFGIMKGVLSGSNLMRNGANSGAVELQFSIEDKDITIRRSLKKTSTGIVQDSGMLIINRASFEGTPQELKSRILELLGYPESLLNKSKSLIFRYTVFTPQEEMKRILFVDKEERLDILRRLFNIDKYKRVKENTLNYSREMRNNINFLEGKLESLADKRKEIESFKAQLETLKKDMIASASKLNLASEIFNRKSEEVKRIELEFERDALLERELVIKESELAQLSKNLDRNNLEISRLRQDIDHSLSGLEGLDFSRADEIKAKIESKKSELKKLESTLSDIISRKAENTAKKSGSERIISKISGLDKCPTCLQDVSKQHVDGVMSRENQVVHACTMNLEKLGQFEIQFKEKKRLLESELDNYAKGERELELKKLKLEVMEEKKKRKDSFEKEKAAQEISSQNLSNQVTELAKKLENATGRKDAIIKSKKELEDLRNDRQSIERSLVELKSRHDFNEKLRDQIEADISRLVQEEKKLNRLKEKKSWLENDFISLVDVIEKHVLARVYNEFNGFFQEWFNTLIEDETVSVRLDDYFSPIIEQNGYETIVENLSGGERTSVALAYRLALNKVINDFLSNIKTRDLIILDEPTEGFSTDQLDRVREVLNQVNVGQTIIVSHEQKMEGFVDHVVRIRKQNHVSRLIA
jgi:DNA repair protein SbcC/Rad50